MGTAAVNWSVDVTIELLNRDVNVFVYQNANVSLSNRAHQLGGRVRQTNYSRLPLKRRLTFEVALNKAAADLMTRLDSGLIRPYNKGSEKCGGDDCAGVP